MASGGVRQDFTVQENLTPGEARTLQFTIKDANGVAVVSFVGWTFTWFLLSVSNVNGLTALTALFTGSDPRGLRRIENAGIVAIVPIVNVPLVATSLPTLAGNYWHELWRSDSGNEQRLSFGNFVVMD